MTGLLLILLSGGTVETVAGDGSSGPVAQGVATEVACPDPFAMAFDNDGRMLVALAAPHRIVRVENGTLSVFAGTGEAGGGDGDRTAAAFDEPYDLELDARGDLFLVERLGGRVRKVRGDAVTTLSSGTSAPFRQPHDLCLSRGVLFVCDTLNDRVCVVLAGGTTGVLALTHDGEPWTPDGPRVIAARGDDELILVLREGNSVWSIDRDEHTVRRLAGTGKRGYSGDGGPAVDARLNGPKGLAVAAGGDLYVADCESHVVRRIDAATGVITTVVGDGVRGDGPDGDSASCRLNRPHGLAFDREGRLHIADTLNNKVRRVTFGGQGASAR